MFSEECQKVLTNNPEQLQLEKIQFQSLNLNCKNILIIDRLIYPSLTFISKLYLNHNQLYTLNGIQQFCNLEVFHFNYNWIWQWDELNKINNSFFLKDVSFLGNPIAQILNKQQQKIVHSKINKQQRIIRITQLQISKLNKNQVCLQIMREIFPNLLTINSLRSIEQQAQTYINSKYHKLHHKLNNKKKFQIRTFKNDEKISKNKTQTNNQSYPYLQSQLNEQQISTKRYNVHKRIKSYSKVYKNKIQNELSTMNLKQFIQNISTTNRSTDILPKLLNDDSDISVVPFSLKTINQQYQNDTIPSKRINQFKNNISIQPQTARFNQQQKIQTSIAAQFIKQQRIALVGAFYRRTLQERFFNIWKLTFYKKQKQSLKNRQIQEYNQKNKQISSEQNDQIKLLRIAWIKLRINHYQRNILQSYKAWLQ